MFTVTAGCAGAAGPRACAGAAVPVGLPALPMTSGLVLMGLDFICQGKEHPVLIPTSHGAGGASKRQNDPIQQNSIRTQSFLCSYLVLYRI